MGGVPAQLVPDNPKVGVDRANWYEPGLNRTCLELATHYRTAILPTRPRKPRDKAKVEVGVLVVERWILAQPSLLLARRVEPGDRRARR
jgi:transposase